MKAEIVSDAGGLEADWWDLWHRSAAGPFQSPAWLLPWRACFTEGRDVLVLLRDGGRLVGLLPLFELSGRLLPWGAGTTDYLDGIFDPALRPDQLGALLDTVAAGAGLPVDLFQLPPGSPLLAMPAPAGWRDESAESEPCPGISLPAELPRNMAQNLRYYRRRAERAGHLEMTCTGHERIEELLRLHAARWRERGEAGVLADPRVADFQRRAASRLDAAGLLRLVRVALDGRTIAMLLGIAAKGRFHYYLGGFDPGLSALGPGTLAIGHAVETASAEGLRHFDFLRGRESYKYRWGAVDRPTRARCLHPPGTGTARRR